jgi:D-arginine dehydrogenase
MTAANSVDVLIVGAGIAGASLAAELAPGLRVALLEREPQAGYHSTGRSAASFSETYGAPAIRALSRASRAFFTTPPDSFSATPLLLPRGALLIGRAEQLERLQSEATELRGNRAIIEQLDADSACAHVPILRRDYVAGAIHEPGSCDIEVHALHTGYLRLAAVRGAQIALATGVTQIGRNGAGWLVQAGENCWQAGVLVNAAGAWADELATLAGVQALGIQPLRRSALLLDAPPGMAVNHWPMVVDIDEQFYFKPDAGRLLASPADETPSPPCDAQPDELDLAICVERLQQATTLEVRRIPRRWAGLRSFSADRLPVVGYDACAKGFFWLAGHGGYGIQTAPALACMAANVLRGETLPGWLRDQGVVAAELCATRFAR